MPPIIDNQAPRSVAHKESAAELLRTKLVIRVGQAAELLSCCNATIHRRIRLGILEGVGDPGCKSTHVTTASITAYLNPVSL